MAKIAPWVMEKTTGGAKSSFIVVFSKQADTSGAAWLPTKEAKGEYVLDLLTKTAEESQGPLRNYLLSRGVRFRAYWIVNMITVEQGDFSLALDLAYSDDVKSIEGNPTIQNHFPTNEEVVAQDQRLAQTVRRLAEGMAPETIQWGITNTNAPSVWSAGFSGTNIVIGGEDTGYYWEHSQLQSKYRGWNGTTADHNYNWHDAVHSGGGSCGADTTQPCDDGAGGSLYHGTHTMGTMVGGDGPGPDSNDYGMAYGATWIGCRNMDRGNGTPTLYIECHQWMLAPTDLNDDNPDPTKAPHVINNSWGCPPSEGCPWGSNILLVSIQNLVNAGIVYDSSNGNDGVDGCGSVETGRIYAGPPAIYGKPWVFSTGSIDSANRLANSSSLGPVTINGSRIKPDISAPGVGILSSYCCTSSAIQYLSGTSMAAPHVAGAIALLFSARPALIGQVERVLYALEQTTAHDVTSNGQPATCGGTTWTTYPSNFYGWGRLNIQAAVNSVCTAAQMATPGAPVLTPGGTSISLSWAEVLGATDYEVWRADASASCRPMYQVTATTGGTTTFNDTGLNAPIPYSYYILAKNSTCTTVAGPCATTVTVSPPPEIAPGDTSSTGLTWPDKHMLSWPPDSAATSYTLYRGLQGDLPQLLTSDVDSCTKYAGAATSTNTIIEDPTGVTGRFFWYLVTGTNDGGEGAAGNATAGARVVNSSGACP
jgi:subtilisin family serine protease